jgi:hypothetical protein
MKLDAFDVSLGRHLMSAMVHHARPFWIALGNLESLTLRGQMDDVKIEKPIYVAGLARSGTSVLIEILASHPDVATHQYRDFPFLFIPYWWRQTLENTPTEVAPAEERAHGDRLMVTPHSPEAMEEVLWMAFFRKLHNPHLSSTLDASSHHPQFEKFYRDHIRKLLLIANRRRYAAKGNYNLTRLEYLLKLFPDARFILPIRRPRDHVASLIKQHRIFTEAGRKYPRSVNHLDRVGHFEFGLHRRCINPRGEAAAVREIESLWKTGESARGWARYWAMLHTWLADRLDASAALRNASLVLTYEDLCARPAEKLTQMLRHCDLPDPDGAIVSRWAPTLSPPTYYKPNFTPEEERAIEEETAEALARLTAHAAASK